VHDFDVATKTIALELDAYEKLRRAKRAPSESFSSVVRRAVFVDASVTASELLRILERQMREGRVLIDEATLNRLDAAQRDPRISASEWQSP
jgi:predicted CopG family antitoxin